VTSGVSAANIMVVGAGPTRVPDSVVPDVPPPSAGIRGLEVVELFATLHGSTMERFLSERDTAWCFSVSKS
jgi:hypothetical protein